MTRRCLWDGLVAGGVAGILGGLPSALAISRHDFDESIQAIALLVPGNRAITSPAGRRMLGAVTHMALSTAFATIYTCRIRRGPITYAAALWFINIKLLAPRRFRRQDRSLTLADHLCWGVLLSLVTKARQVH